MNIKTRIVTTSKQFTAFTMLAMLLALTSCQSINAAGSNDSLSMGSAQAVGMDADRLDRITAAMQQYVDDGLLSGVVTLGARDGKIVHYEAVGYRDLASRDPMEKEDIFRIYSMTKPITGVAMMILYEQGKFRLSDPVEKYIPQFKNLQVYAGMDSRGNMITEPQNHPMTIRELMNHTSGLTYGSFSQGPVDDMYTEAQIVWGEDSPKQTLQQFIDKLARIPLRQQPGTLWHYSVGVDVQGYLVEQLSGQRFGDFLRENITEPLGMVDTEFYVPSGKQQRLAQVYDYDRNGRLFAQEGLGGANDYFVDPVFQPGGHGLVSTAMDYLRFSQMVANGGILDGVRIISPLSVKLMSSNHLPADIMQTTASGNGTSFGLDFAVVEDPIAAESYSKGEFYWSGAAGTWFWIDPAQDLVFVGMINQFGRLRPDMRSMTRRLVYSAIMDSQQ